MKVLDIDLKTWQTLARDRGKWRKAVVVDGRSFFMRAWWAAKRKKKEQRQDNRKESESEYRNSNGEYSNKWRETLNAGKQFHNINMAMAEGRICVRAHQMMKTDLTKGHYTIKNMTMVRVEVARDVLGEMMTALEKAGDASGMFVQRRVNYGKRKNGADGGRNSEQNGNTRRRRENGDQTERRRPTRPKDTEDDWSGLLQGRDLDN
jgi:hypothetical protein